MGWVSFKTELARSSTVTPLDVTVLTDTDWLSQSNNPERKNTMAKRSKMNRKTSQANFTRNAGVHPRNNGSNPMRGGIRF